MLWYGIKSNNIRNLKTIRNLKHNLNLRINSLSFFINQRLNFNFYKVYFYIPSMWNFIILKNNNLTNNLYHFYFYSDSYYFYTAAPYSTSFVKYDKFSNNLFFLYFYKNNFYKLYWKFFKIVFNSFSTIFFKKLKFKGKGYYIFKNIRNTIALQFGYSHRVRIHSYFISVKFLTKTSILMYGINKNDIIKISNTLYNKKPNNIFTGRGIRFTRQIIYKKAGKVSSYR